MKSVKSLLLRAKWAEKNAESSRWVAKNRPGDEWRVVMDGRRDFAEAGVWDLIAMAYRAAAWCAPAASVPGLAMNAQNPAGFADLAWEKAMRARKAGWQLRDQLFESAAQAATSAVRSAEILCAKASEHTDWGDA